MNKLLTTLALALATTSSFAGNTTVTAEYDYSLIAGSPNGHNHFQVGKIGVSQDLGTLGKVDAKLQGAYVKSGSGNDRQSGLEVGYTYPVKVGAVTILPRFGYGVMSHINVNGGADQSEQYYKVSAELRTPISARVTGYTSFSHLGHTNSGPVNKANDVQIGVDTVVSKAFSVRTGVSFQKIDAVRANGIVLAGSYNF